MDLHVSDARDTFYLLVFCGLSKILLVQVFLLFLPVPESGGVPVGEGKLAKNTLDPAYKPVCTCCGVALFVSWHSTPLGADKDLSNRVQTQRGGSQPEKGNNDTVPQGKRRKLLCFRAHDYPLRTRLWRPKLLFSQQWSPLACTARAKMNSCSW